MVVPFHETKEIDVSPLCLQYLHPNLKGDGHLLRDLDKGFVFGTRVPVSRNESVPLRRERGL